MATYPTEFSTVQELAKRIDYDFKTEREKVEAAYLWIIKNIRYDYNQLYETKSKRIWIRYNTEEEKARLIEEALDERLNYILEVRATLCYGYSNLFKRLLDLMEIEAVNINGHTKISTESIGSETSGIKNHSWNAVYLDGKWRLFDLTWAAGYTDYERNNWLPRRNDHYFDIDPQALISTHLPEDSRWQLLNRPMPTEHFFENPIYYKTYFEHRYILAEEEDGLLEMDGRKVKITFSNLPLEKRLFYSLNGSHEVLSVENIKKTKDGKYQVVIYGLGNNADQLTLYSNLQPAIDFKLH